jgi:hypothetical protein
MGAGSFAGGFARGLQSGVNWSGAAADADALDERRNKKAIRKIDEAAQGDYAAAGSPGSFDDFYRDYIVPKKTQAYLSQGDMDSAEAWRTWAESDAARDGSKLFADGIVKAQTGDTEGALRNFIKAGNLRGYGKDLDLGNLTKNADGSMTINFDAPDGRKLAQTFTSADEILSFGATFFNPEAAFERWSTQQSAHASTEGEIDKYRREKEIDVQLGISGPGNKSAENYDKARKQAYEELSGDMDFADLPSKKQRRALEKRTNQILQNMGVRPPEPGDRQVNKPSKRFNPQTGEVMDIDPAEAAPAPVAAGAPEPAEPAEPEDGRDYPAAGPKGDRAATRGDRLAGGAGDDRLKGGDRGLGGQAAAGPTPATTKVRDPYPEARRAVTGITGQLTTPTDTGRPPASTFAEQYATPTTSAPPPSPTPAPTPAPIASKAVVRRMAAELASMKPNSPEYAQLASQIRAARAPAA